MKSITYKFFFKLFFLLYASSCLSSGYQQVITKYTQAMQKLITLHTEKFPHAAIDLTDDNLIFVTYKKIVTPYAMDINGWARIASSSFQYHHLYAKHVIKTQQLLQQYLSEVQTIIAYFPSENRSELLQAFYELIGSDCVDNMFNIVQTLSNQASTNSYDLNAAYVAYQVAHQIYQKGMNISSVGEGLDFTTAMVNNMQLLYSNALTKLNYDLGVGNLGANKIEDIYAQITSYNKYLSQIYADIGDQQKSLLYADRATQAAQYYKNYQQGESDYIKLQTSLKHKSVSLNVNNVTDTISSLNTLSLALGKNIKDAQTAQAAYQQAQDKIGMGKITYILDQLVINSYITDYLAQLWLLYLNDQSSNSDQNGNPFYTAPAIAAFISQANQNSSNPITNQNIGQAFQDLFDVLSQQSNGISALSTNSTLAAYSVDQLMKLIQGNFLQLEQKGEKISSKNNYLLVSMVSVTEAIKILFYLEQLAESLANFMQQTDSNQITIAVAFASQYAKKLDTIYRSLKSKELLEINTLIPYFPAQVSSVGLTNLQTQSWLNWSEQIMLASGLINSSDLATAQAQKVTLKQPQVAQKPVSLTQLSNMMTLAHQDALSQNFIKASKGYENLYTLYSNLYEADPTNNEYIQKVQLIKTLYTATSFAAKIQQQGKPKSWQAITNIPNQYQIAQYQFTNISVSDFGMSQVPTSLLSIAGSTSTTLTSAQQKDAIQLLKAYIICKLLEQQGYNFTDIYTDYTLTQNANIASSDLATVQQLVQQVEIACNNFIGCTVSSITLTDASTIQIMICNNLVIPKVTPLYSSMATASMFFASAQLLFAPSSKNIQLGGTSYIPAQDQELADIMLEYMVYTYLSAGLVHWALSKTLMAQVTATLPKGQSGTQELPKDFATQLNQVNSYVTKAQAMLFAQDQSAYAYSAQLTNQTLAANVRKVFFSTYEEFINWMKTGLIGSPYQVSYRNLITMISNTYVDWSTWLNPQTDAALIGQNMKASIALIENAGDACINTSYIQSLYPGYEQQHYAAAASYYQAARTQFEKNSDTLNATAMEVKILDAYFKGVNQSVDLFLNYVLVNGVTYTHEQTNQSQQISFAQLMQDSQGGFSSTGEQNAYNSVKNLLLNSGKGLTFLMKKVIPSQPVTANKKQEISSKAQSGLSSPVITYLRTKNIMGSNDQQPLYFNAGIARKIYATNMDAYATFKASATDYASWLNVLYSALQAIYAFHYLGATPGETENLMQTQIQAFFTAMQASVVATENSASAYGE